MKKAFAIAALGAFSSLALSQASAPISLTGYYNLNGGGLSAVALFKVGSFARIFGTRLNLDYSALGGYDGKSGQGAVGGAITFALPFASNGAFIFGAAIDIEANKTFGGGPIFGVRVQF